MKRNYSLLLLLVLVLGVSACGASNDESNEPQPKASVAKAIASDLTVEMLTDTRIETGLTPIYLKITTASGQAVTDASVTFTPLMYMADGKNHTAPVYGPPTLDADGLYRCEVVFQMQSSDTGYWDMKVTAKRPNADAVEVTFPKVNVADSGRAATFMYTDPQTSVANKYVASLNLEAAPKVGLNPVIVTVHWRKEMMDFPPVDGLTIELDPQMPSMGHGSPGCVNPTLVSTGRYKGKLSFSMKGEWETTVTIKQGDVVLGTPKFKTTF